MINKVTVYNVKKGQSVIMSKQLPTDRLFGNKHPIQKDAKGYIMTEGFINGRLRVEFYTHAWGTQSVEFNELSANEFLLTDVIL